MLKVTECLQKIIRARLIENRALGWRNNLMQLGAKVVEFPEVIKVKHNVHQANKNLLRAITVLYSSSQ